MIQQLLPNRTAATKRTIIAALIMLVGVVMLAAGYLRNDTTVLLVGVFVAFAGVMTELLGGILLSPR